LADATGRLAGAGVESAAVEAEWLLAYVLGMRRSELWQAFDRPLSEPERAAYATAIGRRVGREPLQQIVGWEEFCGLRFRVSRDVLVPRPETEVLAQWALELLARAGPRPLVIDIGTGSGCLACAVAAGHPNARVLALDLSVGAARVAYQNARDLGLGHRVHVIVADLLATVAPGSADLIVANPPYVPSGLVPLLPPEVRDHEPWLAVDGGPDGMAVIPLIVNAGLDRLRPGGALALETFGDAQTGEATTRLRVAGFVDVAVREDLTGVVRMVAARRPR
jgi:release factor glutamine methyltransferase